MSRKRTNDEFFTPEHFIALHISTLIDIDIDAIYLDRNAGEGNWAVVVISCLEKKGKTKEQALSQVFCIELFEDNCIKIVERLYGQGIIVSILPDKLPECYQKPGLKCMFEHNGELVENVFCGDALKYSMNFKEQTRTFGRDLFEEIP